MDEPCICDEHVSFDEAIKILSEAVKGERMKASIGGSGSLAESYCTSVANSLQAAIDVLKAHKK
jgi:hypothetical protein